MAKRMSKEQERQYYINKIQTNDFWLCRSILVIYDRQTMDEKIAEQTRHHNMTGFKREDVKVLTSFAKQILAANADQPRNIRHASLSEDQKAIARQRMPKYARQMVRIARGLA